MRLTLIGLAVALGASLLASECEAQTGLIGNGVDPFSLYYGFYLPNQQLQSMQPRVEDTINANAMARQRAAVIDREQIYNQASPFEEDLDPLRPFAPRRGGEKLTRSAIPGSDPASIRGTGPALYYNRTARYFPTLKSGRGPNRNIAVLRGNRGGGGGGMPSMPSMPGPR